jgi:hypothetical protein
VLDLVDETVRCFVENVAEALVEIGNEPGRIKTERFGATGA